MPCECFPCSVLNVGREMMMTTKRLTPGNIQNIAWLIYVTCTAFLASTVATQQSTLLTFGSQDRNRITLPDPRVVTCEGQSFLLYFLVHCMTFCFFLCFCILAMLLFVNRNRYMSLI